MWNQPDNILQKQKSSEERSEKRNYLVPQIKGNTPEKLGGGGEGGHKGRITRLQTKNTTDQQCCIRNYVTE